MLPALHLFIVIISCLWLASNVTSATQPAKSTSSDDIQKLDKRMVKDTRYVKVERKGYRNTYGNGNNEQPYGPGEYNRWQIENWTAFDAEDFQTALPPFDYESIEHYKSRLHRAKDAKEREDERRTGIRKPFDCKLPYRNVELMKPEWSTLKPPRQRRTLRKHKNRANLEAEYTHPAPIDQHQGQFHGQSSNHQAPGRVSPMRRQRSYRERNGRGTSYCCFFYGGDGNGDGDGGCDCSPGCDTCMEGCSNSLDLCDAFACAAFGLGEDACNGAWACAKCLGKECYEECVSNPGNVADATNTVGTGFDLSSLGS